MLTTQHHAGIVIDMAFSGLVEIFSAGPGCMPCRLTQRHFARKGIEHTVIPARDAPEVVEQARALGLCTAPIVRVTQGHAVTWWDGYRPDRIDGLV